MITIKPGHPLRNFALLNATTQVTELYFGTVKLDSNSVKKLSSIINFGINRANKVLMIEEVECSSLDYQRIKNNHYYDVVFEALVNIENNYVELHEFCLNRVAVKINLTNVTKRQDKICIRNVEMVMDSKSECKYKPIEQDEN